MNEQPSKEVLRELSALQDSTDAIWRAISNKWFQEQVGDLDYFVTELEEVVRCNVNYIRSRVEEPRLQNVRTGLVIADLEPFRQIATTGEHWLAVHHKLIDLSFVREGEMLNEVAYTGTPEFSLTLRPVPEGKVVVSINLNDVYTFNSVEGKNHRYFVV